MPAMIGLSGTRIVRQDAHGERTKASAFLFA